MPHRINMAIVCLHISAVLYLGVGVLMAFGVAQDPLPLVIILGLLCLLLIVGIELIVWGLAGRKFWAWVAGLCVFGLYVPSIFLPLGALGLWGLLDRGSRQAFGVGVQRAGFEPVLQAIPVAEETAGDA